MAGIFSPSKTGGNTKFQTTGSVRPDPWEVRRQNETVEVPLNCSFKLSGGSLRAVLGQPSSLIGVRSIVRGGYGGKTIIPFASGKQRHPIILISRIQQRGFRWSASRNTSRPNR